jgi:hypothetical protein
VKEGGGVGPLLLNGYDSLAEQRFATIGISLLDQILADRGNEYLASDGVRGLADRLDGQHLHALAFDGIAELPVDDADQVLGIGSHAEVADLLG